MAAQAVIRGVGGFAALCGDTVRAVFRRPFHLGEFVQQTAFIASASLLPVVFVTIPFTIVVQFFIGQLLAEIGAVDLAGAGAAFAVVQELGPFSAVLVVAGAGATAVCADLGARTVREEIDAMRVLGIDPVHRLVVPRVAAFAVTAAALFGFVCVVGLLGTYAFSVLVQGASPGLFAANVTLLVGFPDFVVSLVKSALFGVAAALVACHLGLNAKGGPKGVGDAVNQTVVFTLMVLVVVNTLTTTVYLQLKG
jgi:phospholipid/cholesterol/gamma-HCH transport system permease protein